MQSRFHDGKFKIWQLKQEETHGNRQTFKKPDLLIKTVKMRQKSKRINVCKYNEVGYLSTECAAVIQ